MANIKDKIENIRKAVFGKDVRGSLADGLESINKETETTTSKQEHLEDTFDQLIINAGTSNAEVVDARVDKTNGTSYKKLGDRFDAHSAQMADIVQVKLPLKANDLEVRKKNVPIEDVDISDNLKSMIAGTSPVLGILSPKSVDTEKTTFFLIGNNLVDESKFAKGFYIESSNGITSPNAGYNATGFIPVLGNTVYTQSSTIPHMACYSADFTFISGVVVSGSKITTPANAKYLRMSFPFNAGNIALYQGNSLLQYEKYNCKFDNNYIQNLGKENIKDVSASSINGEININQADFIELGSNIFNKSTITDNNYINETNGTLAYNTGYYCSDFILVSPNVEYCRTQNNRVCYYDVNKIFISSIGAGGTNNFTTPIGCYYIRVSISKIGSDANTYQIVKGSTLLSYEQYGYKIPLLIGGTSPTPINDNSKVVVPSKIYMLNTEKIKIYKNTFIISKYPNVVFRCNIGSNLSDRWEYDVTGLVGDTGALIRLRDYDGTLKKETPINIELITKSKTNTTNLLCIGDSNTQMNFYGAQVKNILNNINVVGTRTYNDGITSGEGRGGWSVGAYYNNQASAFTFPVGINAENYFGDTSFWKGVVTTPEVYDFAGFQKIAKGWNGSSFLYDTNGFPLNPQNGWVVYDNAKFKQYNGSAWVEITTQPSVEFNFSKYMTKYASAFTGKLPNFVSIMLGTNDFMNCEMGEGLVDIDIYITKMKSFISSIQEYNSSIKVLILTPSIGSIEDIFGTVSKPISNSEGFRLNMINLMERLIFEFDNLKIANTYVCPIGLMIDNKVDIRDHVHQQDSGFYKWGMMLSAMIEKLR